MKDKVKDAWNGQWNISDEGLHRIPMLTVKLDDMALADCEDESVWSMAEEFLHDKDQVKSYANSIWCNCITPARSLVLWKVLHQRIPVEEVVQHDGVQLSFVHQFCFANQEI